MSLVIGSRVSDPIVDQGTVIKIIFRRLPWLLMLLMAAGILQPAGRTQNASQAIRVVEGRILTKDEQPQANAVVYLQDQKSLQVRTFITEPDGRYRFGQLSPDVDYQLWAEFKGHKSKTRSISSFDNKKQFIFDLKIDASK